MREDMKREAPDAGPSQRAAVGKATNQRKSNRKPTKTHRVLDALSRRSFNRFEAARLLSDHCLHSTVSAIQSGYGIRVDRHYETVPGYQGIETRCCRYRIAPDQADKVRKVLRGVRQ